jgi:hypothetical protein
VLLFRAFCREPQTQVRGYQINEPAFKNPVEYSSWRGRIRVAFLTWHEFRYVFATACGLFCFYLQIPY